MNRYDFILISVILFVCLLFLGITYINGEKDANVAYVYYDNKLVKTIDLRIDETKEYIVKGYNGDVVIETKKNQIRVKEEKSPLNLCSKQGFISSSLETIVCLPNKVVIKIESSNDELDAVVR
ncbi:MAG TPA: NusG domain II-containing protein [Mollicutes bacterium]|nr:NusG domain II-containing protein [Mollicutes bacterium]